MGDEVPPLPPFATGSPVHDRTTSGSSDLASSVASLALLTDDIHTSYAMLYDSSQPYEFPTKRLKKVMDDPTKIPIVIVGCGSYSPVTYLHLRMFDMVHDYVRDHGGFEIIGSYFSPVSSGYKKEGLAAYRHRVRMCQLAADDSDYLMVDPWEASQPDAQRTAVVLQHFDDFINGRPNEWGVLCNGVRRKVKVMLIAGGDLIQSFATINVVDGMKVPLWAPADLDFILGKCGCFIIERTGADVHDFLLKHQKLYDHRKSVYVVKQFIYNDISSSLVRLFVKRNMSIKYLLPDRVIAYIKQKRLYVVDEPRTLEQEIALMGEAEV